MSDYWGTLNTYRDQLHRTSERITREGAKTVSLGSTELYVRANYQDFQRFQEVDLAVSGDAETTMPA